MSMSMSMKYAYLVKKAIICSCMCRYANAYNPWSNFYEPIHLTPLILNVMSFVSYSNPYRVIPHNFFFFYIFFKIVLGVFTGVLPHTNFAPSPFLFARFDSSKRAPSVVVFSFLYVFLYFYFGIKSLRLSPVNSFIFGRSKDFPQDFPFECEKVFKLNLIT